MVNITQAAERVAKAYATACLLGANTSVPTKQAAATIAKFYLPNAIQFSLGRITQFPNETSLAAVVEEEIEEKAAMGYGINFTIEHLRVEPVSIESAAVWITWHNHPLRGCYADSVALDLYGFRLNPNASNGFGGGWDYVIPDNAALGFKKVVAEADC